MEKLYEIGITETVKHTQAICSELAEEWKAFTKEKLTNYLTSEYQRLKKINNQFSNNQQIDFISIYQPQKLTVDNQNITFIEAVEFILKKRLIALIGNAGVGKSTFLQRLFLELIKKQNVIPILIDLRDLNTSETSLDGHVNQIIKDRITSSERIRDRLIDKGQLIVLFDGFDEVVPNKRGAISLMIKRLTVCKPNLSIVVTSRPYTRIEHLQGFYVSQLDFFSLSEIVEYVNKQQIIKKHKESIITAILKNKINMRMLNVPIVLNLYIKQCLNQESITIKISELYKSVFLEYFHQHDARKSGFVREPRVKIDAYTFKSLMSTYSFISFFEGKYEFDCTYAIEKLNKSASRQNCDLSDVTDFIDDLLVSYSLWQKKDGIYSFLHRSLQNSLTANFILNLPSDKKIQTYKEIASLNNLSFNSDSIELLILLRETDDYGFNKYYTSPILSYLIELYISDLSKFIRLVTGFQCNQNNISFSCNQYVFLNGNSLISILRTNIKERIATILLGNKNPPNTIKNSDELLNELIVVSDPKILNTCNKLLLILKEKQKTINLFINKHDQMEESLISRILI